ncbi:MAG: hypothetical protein WD278_14515 [Pirellulales bacterium]
MERICSQFQVGSSGFKRYLGDVLLDAENIYMLVGLNFNIVALGGLGALGGAIAGAVAHVAGKSASDPFQTTYSELPDQIRQQRVWGRVADEAKVIVLPRGSVKSVSCSIWTGCTIKTDQAKFVLHISPFGIGKARRLLEKYGWTAEAA